MLYPVAPADIQAAAKHLEFRAMILVYLVLETDRFSEYDAHYFPEASIPITRLSEPKVYSNAEQPAGLTVLCAELPCQPEEIYWSMKDEELGALVQESLTRAGLSIRANLRRVLTRRLRHAYPIYRRGFEADFQAVYAWLEQIPNLLTFGRQGLYAHDNTHHALFMAYCAVDCLSQGNHFDSYKWVAYQKVFDTHVVED
jgi:protoporphyrinogen oxidase